MALPMNATPTYTLEVPSSKKVVKFSPFLVKEEKALLIAQQSDDSQVMVNTLKEILTSCIKDPLDVNELAIFDLEYIFTQIRAKSVGEDISLIFPCAHCNDEKAKVKISIDLTNLKVEFKEGHNKKIDLFDDVGVMMKYPSVDMIQLIEKTNGDDVDAVFKIITSSIDYIYDGNEVYYSKEQSKEELEEFVNNLTSDQFKKVQTFFESMPKIKHEVDFNCPVCGAHNHTVLEGLSSFF